MKPAAQLQTCIELLTLLASEARPSDTLLSGYFRSHRFIGAKDRSAIASRVYAMLRHHARLSWWVNYLTNGNVMPAQAGIHEKPQAKTSGLSWTPAFAGVTKGEVRTRMIVYLSLVENLDAKSVAALFEGEKYAPPLLDEGEKKLLGSLTGRTLHHPDMPQAVALECPDWAYEKLQGVFGANLEKELQAMLTEAPLDLRVNLLKATRDEARAALKKAGIEAASTPISPLGLRVTGRPALAATEVFKNGWVEIQDEGSQRVAALVEAKPGMSVVDFCAGAGGKTLGLAASMRNKGRVIACDVLGGRLKRARLRFRRAGAHNIEVRELTNENDQWVKHNAGKHDRVLVDAPCSGLGVWRRNPDARWKNLGPQLSELTALQARILQSAARLVKPGGRLIYATCSLLPEENEKQIEAFLAAHQDFRLVSLSEITMPLKEPVIPAKAGIQHRASRDAACEASGWMPAFAGMTYLRLTPARHGTDGFFAAVMERRI
ncbi:MAG: RsmB/NOP family class I SAM-dependent RNA methyltransferase [Proteobacteria bacterium]|nr:RsmB/NOP family class I SAM-dependent RNA methyltransferase [Pseudomonadota bacterium]